jgi:hypothetical protein
MLAPSRTSLNELAVKATFELLEKLLEMGVNISSVRNRPDMAASDCSRAPRSCTWWELQQADVAVVQVYVDTVGDAGKYQARLGQKFAGIRFTVRRLRRQSEV